MFAEVSKENSNKRVQKCQTEGIDLRWVSECKMR